MLATAFVSPFTPFTQQAARPSAPFRGLAPTRPAGPLPRVPPRQNAQCLRPSAKRQPTRSSATEREGEGGGGGEREREGEGSQEAERAASAGEAESVVREFWRVAATAKFTDATHLFAPGAVYHDTLYPQPFCGRGAIDAHFRRLEPVLDGRFVFVLDAVAPASSGLVGARWHAETRGGTPIPFTRGASMYTIVVVDDVPLFKEAWDFPETPLKTAGPVLALARAATSVLRLFERRKE